MRELGRQRGREAGSNADGLPEQMDRDFAFHLELYPSLGDIDMAAAVRDYDAERLACEPDYTEFPETKGLIDRHLGEREGFCEASGLDAAAAAYRYSFGFYITRRVTAHHPARYDLISSRTQCTNVFFPDGVDGVTTSDNRDDWPRVDYREHIPKARLDPIPADNKVNWIQGSVSSAVVMDEEPQCCFPCDPTELIPDECFDDIHALVDFMTRYREFYGPHNQIWVDRKLNAVAVEKSNCRVAFRWPTVAGAVCVTACSYLDPDLNAFKQQRTQEVCRIKGESPEDSIDAAYFEGCDRRQRRLIDLTNAEAKRGATLWGALNCVADTDVPFPDRVCIAGEKLDPAREANANWTLTQNAIVSTGPRRRGLYRSIQNLHPDRIRPITDFTPKLLLGEGVEMQPEWQKDIDEGRCELAPPLTQ
ncbi:MAG: hypothetical protein CMJ49_02665 [Planctomycetaceae bacterium]|nr:hypothetical protein [Planctomycetaceae bacterium]